MVICVPASHTKIKFTLQPQEQKSGRRVTQGSHTLCGDCCTQPKESSPLEPFRIRDFLVHFAGKYDYLCTYRSSKIKFTLQPQDQKSGRRVTPCSHTLCRGYYTQPKKSSPLELSRIRDFLVHFAQKYGYLCAYHNTKINFSLQPQEQKSGRRVTQGSSTLCGC